ncbi:MULTISPECIES: hypothetical protein [Bacillaceae]|nr:MULTISPECIES: hypothetical protein [Bacillaceae]MCE4050381.1 hypothetical protein [Bacillus sp. Au-Bac7]MDL0434675.1 hypothetical protein [Niallia sp. SS-2023]UPO88364.1 hypothetical protein L8T27_004130 [Niallia sp. Man26]
MSKDRLCLNEGCKKKPDLYGYFCSIECEIEYTDQLNKRNSEEPPKKEVT